MTNIGLYRISKNLFQSFIIVILLLQYHLKTVMDYISYNQRVAEVHIGVAETVWEEGLSDTWEGIHDVGAGDHYLGF